MRAQSMSEYHAKMLKFQSDLKLYKSTQTALEKQPNSRTRSLFT